MVGYLLCVQVRLYLNVRSRYQAEKISAKHPWNKHLPAWKLKARGMRINGLILTATFQLKKKKTPINQLFPFCRWAFTSLRCWTRWQRWRSRRIGDSTTKSGKKKKISRKRKKRVRLFFFLWRLFTDIHHAFFWDREGFFVCRPSQPIESKTLYLDGVAPRRSIHTSYEGTGRIWSSEHVTCMVTGSNLRGGVKIFNFKGRKKGHGDWTLPPFHHIASTMMRPRDRKVSRPHLSPFPPLPPPTSPRMVGHLQATQGSSILSFS